MARESQALYDHIRRLSDSDQDSGHALRRFAQCLQQNFGPAAIAFVSTRDLEGDAFRPLAHAPAGDNSRFNVSGLFEGEEQPAPQEDPLIRHLRAAGEMFTLGKPQLSYDGPLPRLLDRPGAVLAIPLFLDGAVQHWLLIADPSPEMERERALLVANLAFTYMARIADIRRLRATHDRLQGELCKIARLQQMLLPALDGKISGLCKAAYFKACEEAGGDYYDIVRLSQYADPPLAEGERDFWGVIIADASGHGAAAAVEVAMFDAILRTYREGLTPGPAHVFTYANRHLFTRLIRGSYITAFAANFDPQHNRLRYVNGGHPPPLLRRRGAGVSKLPGEGTGIPLGVTRDYTWRNSEVELQIGDILLLYTDGVTEAVSRHGEPFGCARLVEILAGAEEDPEAILADLRSALADHQAGVRQRDDQTVVVLQLIQGDAV